MQSLRLYAVTLPQWYNIGPGYPGQIQNMDYKKGNELEYTFYFMLPTNKRKFWVWDGGRLSTTEVKLKNIIMRLWVISQLNQPNPTMVSSCHQHLQKPSFGCGWHKLYHEFNPKETNILIS